MSVERQNADGSYSPAFPLNRWGRNPKTVRLWHPESPGIKVTVRPSFMRRIGLARSEFATLGEVLDMYRRTRPAAPKDADTERTDQ